MKTIKLFAIAAACIALFASCTKPGEQKEDYSAIQTTTFQIYNFIKLARNKFLRDPSHDLRHCSRLYL